MPRGVRGKLGGATGEWEPPGTGSHLLTPTEQATLLKALARQRGERGYTSAEANVLVEWASVLRVEAILLGLILRGEMLPDVEEGEVIYKQLKHEPSGSSPEGSTEASGS